MTFRQRARSPIAAVTLTAIIMGLTQVPATAAPAQTSHRATQPGSPAGTTPQSGGGSGPDTVAPTERGTVLGQGWERSADRAWTTSGDASGFHLLVADKKNGYSWRTAASLSEPGFDTDQWIGNACVTGSGRRALVAYAPRTFTNKAQLMARGAFTAVVDLDSGKVTKLNRQASLAYFSPGCGLGETAVFTQAGGDDKNSTRLISVDAATGKLSTPIELNGEITSAVPVKDAIIAADSSRLVKIDARGRRRVVIRTDQVPFLLKPDADGGLVYMDRPTAKPGSPTGGQQAQVRRIDAKDLDRADARTSSSQVLANGYLTRMDLTSSASGQVFITGQSWPNAHLPASIKPRPDTPMGSIASTRGDALITATTWADQQDPRARTADPLTARPAKITLAAVGTSRTVQFQVTPDTTRPGHPIHGSQPSPSLAGASPGKGAKTGQPNGKQVSARSSTVDDARTCAVPRNDPALQVYQPTPRQIEWAVDQAITGNLNSQISRPANWKNDGMAAYQPQTLFPLESLAGGGRIPAQVMLGVAVQENNLWQASSHVTPGETGNPAIANYYGTPYTPDGQKPDPWAIDWANADCGYGVTQVTDGMRIPGKGGPADGSKTDLQQKAVALDYAANIAAGVNILIDKWNQTRADGLIIDNGDPKGLENWFFALWAYNSGYHTQTDAAANGGAWGVGFTNNPANPLWKANRNPFLENPTTGTDQYSDAAHPQDWPYPEKVLGWAARPISALESPGKMVVGYRAAWWTNNAARTAVKPPIGLFCTTANQCDPTKIAPGDSNQPGLGPCTRSDLKCWWNQPASWKHCAANLCGNEILRFDSTYPEQPDGTSYPPNCTTTGLPDNALIIDDVPDSTPIHRPSCSLPKPTSGSFSFTFGSDNARIDLHQLGSGYGGHFWFTHSRDNGDANKYLQITGTWTLNAKIDGAAKVLVHLPDHGAQTQASYQIQTASGTRTRLVDQGSGSNSDRNANQWLEIGVYRFNGVTPQVEMSNLLIAATGDRDVAFDAVAFVPGDYPDLAPDFRLPAPNPNAPDPADYDPPTPIGQNQATKATAAAAPQPSRKCGPVAGQRKGWTACTTITPTLRKHAVSGAKANPPNGDLCNLQVASMTRKNACLTMNAQYDMYKDGQLEGSGLWTLQQNFNLSVAKPTFTNTLTLTPIKISVNNVQDIPAVTLELDFTCPGPCSMDTPSWTHTWATVADSTTASQTVTYTWTNGQDPANPQQDNLNAGFVIKGSAPGMQPFKSDAWSTSPLLQIRCDNKAAGSSGCVFANHIPTMTIDTAKWPLAAAYYWLMMQKLSNHPGSVQFGSPLHRLAGGEAARKQNYDIICGSRSGWTSRPESGSDAQCDEYPFAGSRESGGQTLNSGEQCVQMYTAPVSPGSSIWSVYEDDRYGIPDWAASTCGRASMPPAQNKGGGGGVGGIVSKYRVLENDPYYVRTPGFEACDPNQPVCVVVP